jgi:hypothetical protein
MQARNFTAAANMDCGSALFEYTGGRFLSVISNLALTDTSLTRRMSLCRFNESRRREERQLSFNIDALTATICSSLRRPVSDLISFTKLAEGGFNRVFEATFQDGYAVLARIPFHIAVPTRYAVASEAATLAFLRSRSIPVPKAVAYSCDQSNPVGAEYLILEKVEGRPLSDRWFMMDNKTRVKVMRQVVDVETRFMALTLPASGSLYYRRDLLPHSRAIPVSPGPERPDQIVVGPTAQHAWWYGERASLETDRGPFACVCFSSAA